MAIIILGKSTCSLCGKLLLAEEAITGLPPIANTDHPLYDYFDRGFHQVCFDTWQFREEALRVKEEILRAIQLDTQRYRDSPAHRDMLQKRGKPSDQPDK